MKKNYTIIILVIALTVFQSTSISAQNGDSLLTVKEQRVVIDSIGNKLKANYIFPKIANEMTAKIEDNLQHGIYKKISDPQEFANKLTNDLQSISKDKHLRVRFDPEGISEQHQVITAEDSLKYLNRRIANLKRGNFGFKEVKILDGNIGYLDLRSFSNVEYAGETAVSAMNFLSNADAIIIDLRHNGGGSPAMIQLITSYLYNSESVHLNNFYWRPTDRNTQTWTLPYVQGKRSPDTPVYILTSKSTFSAAEEFCYNLKNLERAILIGETTGGGAHPGGTVNATDRYTVWIPTGRAINPITNTNWEGTGVSPHIEVRASDALTTAHIEALETLDKSIQDKENSAFYSWHLKTLKIKIDPVIVQESTLKSYAGNYGPRVVSYKNNSLFYQRGTGTKYKLTALSSDEFMLEGLSYFRVKFIVENNKVTAIQGNYDNGNSDKNLRSKK